MKDIHQNTYTYIHTRFKYLYSTFTTFVNRYTNKDYSNTINDDTYNYLQHIYTE